MDKIYIIDAINYLYRSYYAIGPMTSKKGISTSAVYGFIRTIKKFVKDFNPKYLVAVFDGENSTKSRKAIYEKYKIHRKRAPDDLYPQFDLAKEFLECSGIPTLCINDVEADDSMASIASWARKEDFEVYLLTSDKDLYQLIDDHTFALNVHKENLVIDEKKVVEKFKVKPKQILDYLAMVGDSADNIPGIPGFGPKTASDLLNEFGTLDYVLQNPDKIKNERRKEKIINEREIALLSKELATLNYNVDTPKNHKFYEIKTEDREKLINFYKELNFTTLLKDIDPEINKKKDENNIKTEYKLINSINEFNDLVKLLSTSKEISIDTETTNLRVLQSKLVGIGFCIKEGEAFYVPLNGNIEKSYILEKIKPILENENISFIGHNIKYDYHIFLNYNIKIKKIGFDTILASYLLNPQNRKHSLDMVCLERFEKKKINIKDLIGSGKKQITMQEVEIEKVCAYCCEDVDYTFRLKNILEKELKEKKLDRILYDLEIPLIYVLASMERYGIYIDKEKLKDMSTVLNTTLRYLEGEIFSEAGKQFNINSPKQLSEILYVDLALTPPKGKKVFSTAADVLEKLKGQSPIINHIIKYREFNKLLSTYVDAIPKLINPNTNRVHTTFNQSTVATGRLSSLDPNLQNIPIRTTEGKKIREGFKPQMENWSYISSDYSQIELRLLAHFSSDPNLLNAFNNDEDIHKYTASLVYNVPLDEVTSSMRYLAKAVNFGILYGQGPYGLSEQIGISIGEAKEFIKKYFERYEKVNDFLNHTKENIQKHPIAYTLIGRQRPINEIFNKNPIIKKAAERLSINTPLQGTAADLIKIAMIEVDKEIKKNNLQGYMILQIHDELLFEVPDSEIDIFKKIIKDKMENAYTLKVPLKVDIEVGKNWAEC
ncbi:MAG: DNA polymerase I [Candidatus Anoxychlamydiales bacterium]|nr:DNA polymerase I [Candidatus Anoxychlamydiales bacterium]